MASSGTPRAIAAAAIRGDSAPRPGIPAPPTKIRGTPFPNIRHTRIPSIRRSREDSERSLVTGRPGLAASPPVSTTTAATSREGGMISAG